MKIELIKGPRQNAEAVEISSETTVEMLAERYAGSLPYIILAAKINNKIEELTITLKDGDKVEFLDMRNPAANLIYQHSLSLLYLRAINDVLGEYKVEIQNSLNKGLYTEIKGKEELTGEEVTAIEERMKALVLENVPYVCGRYTREEAIDDLTKRGNIKKLKLLEKSEDVQIVKFYSLGDCRNFFYGLMVPSTKYLKYFELRKYRKGVLLRFPHPSDPGKMPGYVDEVKLYKAFGEATKWGRLLEVSFLDDLNTKVDNGEYKELVQMSEALHDKKIVEIANEITEKGKRIILIAGPSSSGKTTFAKRLCIQLRVNGLKPLYMGTDDYFLERTQTPLDENGEKNFEDVEAIDIDLFNRNMNDLLLGNTVDIPTFDFMQGTKMFGKRITSISGEQPIVIEGIHALNAELTKYIGAQEKFKIYISPLTQLNVDEHNRIPTTDSRMLRRMVRDYRTRGHSAKSTINAWPKVRAGEDKNIFPFSGEADVLFNSALIYETAVLRKYVEPLLAEIGSDEPEYCEAVRMLKFIKFFNTIEDDSIIANNSIIREFIGGSILA